MNEGEEGLDTDNSSYLYVALTTDIPRGLSKSFSIRTDGKKITEIAIFNLEGTYYAISNSCAHKGGPLSKGFIKGEMVTCPWHGWKYSIKTGKSPHKGGDSVNSYPIKIKNDKIYVSSIPSNVGKRLFQPHKAYLKLKDSVDDYLLHKSSDSILPVDDKKVRILGISTTNANDKIAPRQSTSEDALLFALEYAKKTLKAETVLIKLRELEFNHCEGYYSKNANACIFPCSISERDREDQMIQIYEKVILWADIVLIATPIRWGSASSLYYKMIQRMNCIQNQIITNNRYLIRDKVAAFIITGGQDNVQHVAGELFSFWSQMGFVFGKFPFAGWTRGWYAEDTENNYDSMTSSLAMNNNTIGENKISKMSNDLINTIKGAFEIALLLKQNRYDQKVLYTKNED
ncbi:Rieske 2Fe-2S domain-containing protein [Candidatus Nitrosocosmicus franklandus]|uniref:Rieske [2Fe-2S] iron-sulphur domain superfamily n=1 Tax=Candidatus Nitrosocosmicus franklandianus TaxID=1798806 RepID=A0A484IA04_9ARCH|nr:Rieske 2Fe-2S domain-containing protein [Candidatus Nitrosocosmicus franklandus]VFJ13593.1 Rieske [2Fe-2S] iron-sulphur domain superfamily [Candidatus Nitrosocosmicus franklandus]